ncbi:unnamed protein product [Paramecium primaurelia]|uniref:Insulin-like growth factor binding protein, N-terminal n=1 Tax=Paramecium primaurelia TaxID=5886 RepID=A0A8S1QKV4_PARPR|nr:unnamed protein product [Paramecium primaurelia]
MYIANPNGNLDGWSILNAQFPYLTNCAGITIFGGFDENTMISRSFSNLDPHYQLELKFQILIVDSLSTADLEVELDQDNFAESMSTQINDQQNYCGQNDKNEYIKSISFQLEHTKDIVNIFTKIKQNNQQRLQWGILKMEFQLDICYIGCTYCSGPKQSDCQSWHNLFYSFENTLFSNLIEINHQTHEFSQYYECSQCERILNIDFVQTNTNTQVQLKENFLINQEIILQLYDDGTMQISMILDYGIREFNFRLYSRWGSVAQQVQIQYQLIYHVDEIEFPFFPGCLNYLNKQCLQCQEGWKFNTIEKQCQPICGNQKIEGYEECDDGNFKAHDGCFECKYSCIQNCIHCQMGICEQCASGFKFDEKMENCLPICGDGMLVPQISQVCNDGNLIQEEDCYQCRQECDEYCSICIYFYCFQCMEGFQMVNGMCNPICGDKIVLPEFEECDDGNNQKNDGCHECKLSCYDGCEVCEKGICKIDCKLLYGQGYYFIEDSCQSICGDGIIAINEECDDGNEIEFDGCFNCRYTCETNCLDCKQGECSTYQSIVVILNQKGKNNAMMGIKIQMMDVIIVLWNLVGNVKIQVMEAFAVLQIRLNLFLISDQQIIISNQFYSSSIRIQRL